MKIPSLGNTAEDILHEALNIDTAGLNLIFKTVFNGNYQWVESKKSICQMIHVDGVPCIGAEFPDSEIMRKISEGEVGIFVESARTTFAGFPHYSKEYHRATGRKVPIR